MTTNFTIREAYSAGINLNTRVDFERGIVFDVELLGPKSKNGKRYESTAIREASNTVETVGSYIDHPDGENNNRSIKERFGRFIGPYINNTGVLCAREYHYDKKNAFADSFEWMLKNCPNDIGFSINANAGGFEDAATGEIVVTRVFENHGFDLVDRPATTNGIFAIRESLDKKKKSISIREQTTAMFPQAFTTGMSELAKGVSEGSIDPATAKKSMSDLLKLITPADEPPPLPADSDITTMEASMGDSPDEMKVMEQAIKSPRKIIKFLAGRLEFFKTREQVRKLAEEKQKVTDARIAKANAKFTSNPHATLAITGVFREQLANAKDDTEVDRLIEDRYTIFNTREQVAGVTIETPISAPAGNNLTIEQQVAKAFG